jgi:regulator of protease activity HflC (stomatin/prohibitin superfamily)
MIKLLIVVVFLFAVLYVNVARDGKPGLRFQFAPLRTLLAFIAFILILPLTDSFGIVPAGDTGVVTQFGAVQMGNLKHEGLYFVAPGIQAVHVLDTKPHKIELNDTEAVTSDRQEVHTSVALLVQIDPSTADKTYDQYRDTIIDQVVMPKFQESVKAITAKYDAAFQVRNRGVVQTEMLAYIQHELANKGVIIGPGALSIINFAYNPSYQQAIEETAVAQQNLTKANAQLKVAQIEAQQRVATARGEAEAQALLAHTITQTSLQFEFYKHWDGKLPAVVGSGTNILDMSSLLSPSDGRHEAR